MPVALTTSLEPKMLKYSELTTIQLEITTRCNARCPQCRRNLFGGERNPYLPDAEFSLSALTALLPITLLKQLNRIVLCGNYGDAMLAHDCLSIVQHFKSVNPVIEVEIATNGSYRDPGWWERLAQAGALCRFGIDGLADTNHLYRRGTSWERIMQNVKAFIRAGGRAEWNYIVFKHNEHQVEDARYLSTALGFECFNLKATPRFFRNGVLYDSSPVMDRRGAIEYHIYPPTNPRFRNAAVQALSRAISSKEDYDSYLATTSIICKALKWSSIYINAEGFVVPCGWLGAFYRRSRDGADDVKSSLEAHGQGLEAINGKFHTVQEILETPVFQALVPSGDRSNRKARLRTCSLMCGACAPYDAQRVIQ
jgi:MoaA/NifB/PqqE/SkfB family radical SAM enzyme